jgi:hypothetical protein
MTSVLNVAIHFLQTVHIRRTMTSRHYLTLNKKIQLIHDDNDGNGLSQRKLAVKYNISLGSVSNILKRKQEYLHDYQTHQYQDVKRKLKDVNWNRN